jgi:hypothetical protein
MVYRMVSSSSANEHKMHNNSKTRNKLMNKNYYKGITGFHKHYRIPTFFKIYVLDTIKANTSLNLLVLPSTRRTSVPRHVQLLACRIAAANVKAQLAKTSSSIKFTIVDINNMCSKNQGEQPQPQIEGVVTTSIAKVTNNYTTSPSSRLAIINMHGKKSLDKDSGSNISLTQHNYQQTS